MLFTPEKMLDLQEQSKLKLTGERQEMIASQMEAFVRRAELIGNVDTEGVTPLVHIFPTTNVFRDDEVTNKDRREALLQNAPEHKDGHYKVPKAIE